eukprot:g27979.t1
MEPMEPIFDSETSSCAWMQSSDLCSLVVSTSGSGQRPTVEIRARWVKVTLGEAVLLDAELGGEVNVEESTWTLSDGLLSLELSKKSKIWWVSAVQGGRPTLKPDPTAKPEPKMDSFAFSFGCD